MVTPVITPSRTGLHPSARFVDSCWTIPFIAACMSLLVSIPQTNSGLLFVLFMDNFAVPRSVASWPKTVDMATTNLMGFALGAIQHRVSIHNTILAGAFICPIAVVASAFVPNMTWMSVTLGFLYGASFGIIVIGTSVHIVAYFDQYRGAATGLKFLGISLSGIVGPSLLSYLAFEYGLGGALILTGGMALNLIPLSLLLRYARPTECLSRKARSAPGHLVNEGNGTAYGTTDRTEASSGCRDVIKPPECAPQKVYEKSGDNVSTSTDVLGTIVTAGLARKPQECMGGPPDSLQRSVTSEGIVSQVTRVLKSPCFYVLLVAMVSADFTLPLFTSTIVDYARDKGVPLSTAAQLVIFQCLGGFLGRLAIPVIADRVAHSRSPIAALSLALLSLAFWLMPHVGGIWAVGAVTFVAGIQQGYLNAFKPVLVADSLGVESVAASWGLMGLATVPLLFCEPSIVGAFRDMRGSYDNLYRLCGGLNLFAAILLSAQACLDAKKRRSDAKIPSTK
ncbi:monocarboxylate transporter 14-like isoform X2 [Amblyomma americanum]